MEKILIVEDDADINRLLVRILEKEGYQVVSSFSGTEGELRLQMEHFDLMICDLMLPGLSGEELIQRIRERAQLPIIALTAKGALEDKVNVLELGADDYMTKPFEARELVARVRAGLRRSSLTVRDAEKREEPVTRRELILDQNTMTVTLRHEKLELTAHEFSILRLLMESPGKVFSKEALYEAVWKNGYYGEDNTISVHISNIRKKMARITEEEYIGTVWGIGYRLT